jgi:RNA polymerase sigma factor (sigma-70 family)
MSFLTVPAALEQIFARPGEVWAEEDHWQVAVWLSAPPQRNRLLRYVALQVACTYSATTSGDAEDVWSAFCLERLGKVARHYDPGAGPFVPFLLLALKRTCWREGKRLRFQLDRIGLARAGEPPPALEPAASESPEQAAERREAARRLQGCVAALPAEYRAVIVQHYFSDKQVREIADTLGISEGATKVRLHRARRKLETCLLRQQPL